MSDGADDGVNLTGSELAALSELALGNALSAEARSGPIAALAARGLVTVEGDTVEFSENLRATFLPMAACRLNLIVMDDAGSPWDQFFVGGDDSVAYVPPQAEGLSLRLLSESELPLAVAACLALLLEPDGQTDPPNAENLEAIGDTLGKQGLQARAWGGLVVSRPDAAGQGEAANEWIVVIRTQAGYVWQYPEKTMLAFADDAQELADLVEDLLARG